VVVWAIASEERNIDELERFVDALDLSMPVLYDEGGLVHADYVTLPYVPSAAYPEEWIIGTDGAIAYHASLYDHAAVVAVIEAELAGE
jgi:peroxiredoxin